MHLFRWARFLSWKSRRRPSTPRRSSRWLLRHFHRSGSSRASLEAPSLSVSNSFDLRPSMVFVDEQPASTTSERTSRDETDRKFIEEFHRSVAANARLNKGSSSPTGSQSSTVALARVSSIFHTSGRSTILDRASIVNLFNQLQFEMPPVPQEPPAPPDDTALRAAHGLDPTSPTSPLKKKTRSQKRLAKRKLKKKQHAATMDALHTTQAPLETEALLANTEPSFFRQYMLRAKPKTATGTSADDTKFRPLSSTECHAYLQSVALNPPTIGSRGDLSPPGSPAVRVPMQFLFFGGCAEEDPHQLREVDTEPRRYRARFVADQPTPSWTTNVHIKPTLVRGLPPVFEPRFDCMYI